MPSRRHLLALVAFAAALVAAAPRRPEPAPQAFRGAPAIGQWVWTRADAALLDDDTVAGIFVGTVHAEETIAWTRALSPQMAPGATARAAVIRFDDSLHARWDDADVEPQLTAQLEAILAQIGDVPEIQLDYDAPTRRLARWGNLVRRWAEGPLAGRSLWVTSIPAHLGDPATYGRAFEGAVDGHILQVFDTGLTCTPRHVARLARQAKAAGLPYRVGVGAFERGERTDHGAWFRQWRRLASPSLFRGLWIFPAGQPYRHLLDP